MRAISLLSGGLDSLLATKLILDQKVEVTAFNSVTVFCTCTPKGSSCSAANSAVKQLEVPLKTVDSTQDLIKAVKKPRYAYGSYMNPCIDCRVILFRKAAEYMNQIGASFIVTGEVLGERPMSQRLASMKLIERESNLAGMVVRPLSADLLQPTIPELRGWIDRTKLLSIQGRSRKPQLDLANFYGFKDYPCPAGGCRLTEPGFSARMQDLMKYKPNFSLDDVILLKQGRHFRLSPKAKAIVGRNDKENKKLRMLSSDKDIILKAADIPGPLAIIRGEVNQYHVELAAAITARYGKLQHRDHVEMSISYPRQGEITRLQVKPAYHEMIEQILIGSFR